MKLHKKKKRLLAAARTPHVAKMDIKKVNLVDALGQFTTHWDPHIIGQVNNHQVKVAKLQGEFVFHLHEHEDEMFLVIRGRLKMELEDKTINLEPGELIIIPRGTLHKPVADEEVEVLLFEPETTINTGNVVNELTKKDLEHL